MAHLPTYVYVLFCALVYIGVKRCFVREVRPVRPVLFPVVFVGLGLSSLGHLFPKAGVDAYAAALAMLVVGSTGGGFPGPRGGLQWHGTWLSFDGSGQVVAVLFVILFRHKHIPENAARANLGQQAGV